jgi:hypothetical protein
MNYRKLNLVSRIVAATGALLLGAMLFGAMMRCEVQRDIDAVFQNAAVDRNT